MAQETGLEPGLMARILIVDDSSFQRRMIRGLLLRMGHEVIEAGSGSAGLEVLYAEEPDLMTIDLLMPELTGYQLLERLRAEQHPIPRVVLTADVQASARRRCMELGALDVLTKPPKEPELRGAIESVLAGAASS